MPLLTPARFKWIESPTNFFQRRWALLAAYLIVQAVVFVGSPTVITPILSLSLLFFTRCGEGFGFGFGF